MLSISALNTCLVQCLLKIYFYTVCFVLIVRVGDQMGVMCIVAYKSHLPDSGLCVNHSKSCVHQLKIEDPNLTNDTCMMIFHPKQSSVCDSANILEGEVDDKEQHGKMMIQTYFLREENFSSGAAFNVSFSDVKWKKIYMRFIENQVKAPSLCREFQLIPGISSSFTLYFDCLWRTGIDQKAYHFEYQAFTPSGESFTYKYLFLVPNSDQIDYKTPLENWTVFMVVDVTAMPERLVLRLQVAPKRLGIRGYKVQVEKTLKENSSWIVDSRDLYPEPGQMELRFPFETGSRFGKYIFTATPLHDNCTSKNRCAVSKTPPILIEMAEPKFLIGAVVVVILIPIVLISYFIWKRNCDTNDEPTTPPGPPKVLLMYSSASVLHVRKMIELAKYLNRVCGVNAMIDELGIPESGTKDPLKWYIEAFNEADYVIIFASPVTTDAEKDEARRFSRYQHKEQIAQNQLAHRLCSTETKCKFFSVSIPGTNWNTLPVEAGPLKRYIFPRDLDPVLMLIGSACQCDHGAGFNHALELAEKQEEAALPPPLKPLPITAALPPPPPQEEDDDADGRASTPCCNNQSASELDLVSSQQYLSDTDGSDQSIDNFNLLGES